MCTGHTGNDVLRGLGRPWSLPPLRHSQPPSSTLGACGAVPQFTNGAPVQRSKAIGHRCPNGASQLPARWPEHQPTLDTTALTCARNICAVTSRNTGRRARAPHRWLSIARRALCTCVCLTRQPEVWKNTERGDALNSPWVFRTQSS